MIVLATGDSFHCRGAVVTLFNLESELLQILTNGAKFRIGRCQEDSRLTFAATIARPVSIFSGLANDAAPARENWRFSVTKNLMPAIQHREQTLMVIESQ